MRFFDLLTIVAPDISPESVKIHLAMWNGEDDPINLYLTKTFDEWQRWQTRKNFERKYLISFIKLPAKDKWLFAGIYFSTSQNVTWVEDRSLYYYELLEDPRGENLSGRLITSFRRAGRQSYLNAENWLDEFLVNEILSESLSIGEFPGFKKVHLLKDELDLIVNQSVESWRVALSNVCGVYLISDTLSGKLYVGSAYGIGGIWQRWSDYVFDGHGGNVELSNLLKDTGIERSKSFRFSILEVTDLQATKEEVIARESHWKNILMSRAYGLNAN